MFQHCSIDRSITCPNSLLQLRPLEQLYAGQLAVSLAARFEDMRERRRRNTAMAKMVENWTVESLNTVPKGEGVVAVLGLPAGLGKTITAITVLALQMAQGLSWSTLLYSDLW